MKAMVSVIVIAALIFAILSAVGVTNTVAAKTVTADGITFEAPTGWKIQDKENRFTSIDTTLDYDKGAKAGAIVLEHDDAFSGVDLYKMELVMGMAYPDSSVFESGEDKYFVNNQSAPYVISTYTKTNLFGYKHDFVVMAVAVQLNDYDAVNVQFVAQENDFDKLLPQVEKIIQSIKPTTMTMELTG
jgi:hypothetical protein